MSIYTNGICIIQSNFLDKRFKHWTKVLRDKLKVMNALESHLRRRWVLHNDVPVNTSEDYTVPKVISPHLTTSTHERTKGN